MAEINVTPDYGVDTSGARYTQEGFVDNTPQFEVEKVKALTEGAVDIFTAVKKSQAIDKSKSLLEEFTGFQRKSDILSQDLELEDEENALRNKLGNAQPGSLERDMSTHQLSVLARTRDSLARDYAAVEQGKLSLEEYRRRAESLFYQQVVHTPGLKKEIAAVMTEYLGIDPRGQEAAIEIENRKAQEKLSANENAKLKTQMISDGDWVFGQSDQWNFDRLAQVHLNKRQAAKSMTQQMNEFQFIKSKDEETRKIHAQRFISDVQTLQPDALKQLQVHDLGEFGKIDLMQLTAAEIRDLNPDVRAALVNSLTVQASQYMDILRVAQASNDQMGERLRPFMDSITDRRDALIEIVQQTGNLDLVQAARDRIQAENDIVVQNRINGIMLTYPEAVDLAALGKMFGESSLLEKTAVGNVFTKVLRGTIPDLASTTPEEKKETLTAYESLMYSLNARLSTGYEMSEPEQKAVFTQLNGISRHMADEFNPAVRQQMFRIAANKDLMKQYEQFDARGKNNFLKAMMGHQDATIQKTNEELADRGVAPSAYYLTKDEGGTWMVKPTENAIQLRAERTRGKGPSAIGRTVDPTAAENELYASVNVLNNKRDLLSNLVLSRAEATGVSENEAARQVATSFGFNPKDIKVQSVGSPEKKSKGINTDVGFGDPFRKKPSPVQEINMDDLTVDELNALSDESAAAVARRNAEAGLDDKP